MLLRSCYQLGVGDSRWRSSTRSGADLSDALTAWRTKNTRSAKAAERTRSRGGRAAAGAGATRRGRVGVEGRREIIFSAIVFSVISRSRRKIQIGGIKCKIKKAVGAIETISFASSTSCRLFSGRPADGGRFANAKPKKDTRRVMDNTVTSTAAGCFLRCGMISDSKLREGGRIRGVCIIKQQDWYHPSTRVVLSGRRLPAVVRERSGTERTACGERPRPVASRVSVVGQIRVHGDE